jgi:dihydrofolate synthase/folylpolyglutamate synthase
VLPGRPVVVLDVAHNPHAAATLAQNLDHMGFHPYTYAVFGAMHDKDIDGVIAHLKKRIDHWYVTDLPLPRAATADHIKQRLLASHAAASEPDSEISIRSFSSPEEAFTAALNEAGENDRIAVFGSFFTVAGVMGVRNP